MTRSGLRGASLLGVLVVAIGLNGCRQPDGPLPEPTEEQRSKIDDIARDLQAVGRGEADAVADLRTDLENLGTFEAPADEIDALVAALAQGLRARELSTANATRLSEQLFLALQALELSARQTSAVQREISAVLTEGQVGAADAEAVAQAAGGVQQAITLNVKRWWHRE
jgi:hypothetical protein